MADIYTNFSQRDYTSNFERLLTILTEEVPELTDRNHSDGGISLIRLLARETDMLGFYIDEAFIEGFINTARFLQSLIDLGSMVDIRPMLTSPAATTLTITRGDTAARIVIPEESVFSRADGLIYSITEEAILETNENSVQVPALQGTYESASVIASDFDSIDSSMRMRYNLGVGVVESTVEMIDNTQQEWTRVDTFFNSQADDTHFRVDLNADTYEGVENCCFLTLGDGIYGTATPPTTATITYVKSDGLIGNCGIGTITSVDRDFLVTVSNLVAATGGSDIESVESLRSRIPRLARTQRRGLTVADYEAMVSAITGVVSVQAIDRNSGSDWPYLYIFIYVYPSGGGTLSNNLKTTIEDACAEWGAFGNWSGRYVISDVTETPLDISLRVGKRKGYSENTVSTYITTALTAALLPGMIEVGDGITLLELTETISKVAGVDYFSFIAPIVDVAGVIGAVPVLGTVSVSYV
jgi:uncharacterized phage protein gp47/JayE